MKVKYAIKTCLRATSISTAILLGLPALAATPLGPNEIANSDVPLYDPPVDKWKEGISYDPYISNQYPVALVHGFFGWGRDELTINDISLLHFGGLHTDIQEVLKSQGVSTVSPAMGPLSSDWDRACELYAQLLGKDEVDYGEVHSYLHGHKRFVPVKAKHRNNKIDGLGELDDYGLLKKVNLVTHSQGTPTARLLAELLAHGHEQEKHGITVTEGWWIFKTTKQIRNVDEHGHSNLSGLFEGDQQWIQGIASISGANDGSLLAHSARENLNIFGVPPLRDENGLSSFASNLISALGADQLYDLKFDQFMDDRGVVKIPKDSPDTALYDLSPDGAKEINEFATIEPDIYYFSWANNTTYTGSVTGFEWPELNRTNPVLTLPVTLMGTFNLNADNADEGGVDVTKEWWKNDGIVSTRSMRAPINGTEDIDGDGLGDGEPSIQYSNNIDRIRPGLWHFMGELDGYDHWDTLGIFDLTRQAQDKLATDDTGYNINRLYLNAVKFLRSTPAILPPEFE